MESYELIGIGILIGWISIFFIFLLTKPYKKPKSGAGIIRTGMGGIQVSIDKGMFVFPIFHQHHELDLLNKQLDSNFVKEDVLQTKDLKRVEVIIKSYWRVNKNLRDIINVYQTIGVDNSNDINFIKNYFSPRIKEAVAVIISEYRYEDLIEGRAEFKLRILNYLGQDFGGYIIDDLFVEKINKLS